MNSSDLTLILALGTACLHGVHRFEAAAGTAGQQGSHMFTASQRLC